MFCPHDGKRMMLGMNGLHLCTCGTKLYQTPKPEKTPPDPGGYDDSLLLLETHHTA